MTNEVKTKRRKTRSLEYSDSVWGYAFIMPMLIGFLIITVLPVIMTFVYSMTDKNMMSRTTNFIAMDNFVKLFSDKTFRSTMWQTLEFTVLLIPSNMILTLGLASLLKDKFKGCGFFRTAVFTPVVTSVVVWGVLWKYIFQTDNGLINSVLKMMGITGPQWLMNLKMAIPISVFVTLVKGLGMNMVIFIGAMLDVPEDYYEAAELDGANKFQQFFKITLPNIAPSIFLVLILTTIGSLKVFGQVKALTNGGPGTSSYVMVFYIYQMAFQSYKFGYASAASVILFLIIVALTILQWKMRKRWVFHED
ncbi:MAG: sugar ABC transporter permease [Lachnospiraceae bacterium]|jgi:multiple sugar transport system permease protein|nr:sugar ABC transporter permease [Lachnospiraceae bacterium]GFI18954.1 L-arabinose transport system permease protein AraP [Lachnospiraceae bacterium]